MKSKALVLSVDLDHLVLALGIISGKWKLRLIYHLLGGTKRFGELRRVLTGVHRGTLSYELRCLERDGIVRRTQFPTMPPTVEYTLTAKGVALKPVLIAISRWIERENQPQRGPVS